MKIKYLGTAAAEGIPAIFCHCKVCNYARKHGGKEIRTRTQALIDNDILIDFGPDTYMHLLEYGLDISMIEVCLITHTHSDHLFVGDILMRKKNHAIYDKDIPPLNIYGGSGVEKVIGVKDGNFITKDGRVVFQRAYAYKSITYRDYTIVPLPAYHKTEEPFIYLIQKDNKNILYAHDTDIFYDEVWSYLSNNNIILNLVSLDCTEGIQQINYSGHMNFERDFIVREKMLQMGIANDNTIFVANHFSHNGLINYADAINYHIRKGFIVAYDGMELVI